MKREIIYLLLGIMLISFANAASCSLDARLINQDPYPAMPGEYVELVFQLTGVENPECGNIGFSVIEEFPFSLNPEQKKEITLKGGTYAGTDYKSYLIIPYKIRVHEDALKGNNSIKVFYYSGGNKSRIGISEDFEINVDNVRTDFEISIKDYDYKTNILTLEILNIGEHDAEALTIEAPEQENVDIKGNYRSIVGSLDSKEDSTFTFEAIPRNGNIKLKILYTDKINKRREVNKEIVFDSSYFQGRKKDEVVPKPLSYYIAIGEAVLFILIWLFSWFR